MKERPPSDDRPIDPLTKEPLEPRDQPGYYPDFQVLDQQAFWDEATRRVVLDRVENVPPLRFFDQEQARVLEAVFARLLPQEDRTAAKRIPILPFVDERLHLGKGDGYRLEGMPPDPDAYRIGVRAIEFMAQEFYGGHFIDLCSSDQEELLELMRKADPRAALAAWGALPPHRFFLTLMHDALQVYYAHPWAWDEIGFGGPAYPRGYMRLERGEPEPWESEERRYEWEPPASCRSSSVEAVPLEEQRRAPPSQGGTH